MGGCVISCEEDAWRALRPSIAHDEDAEEPILRFLGWPRLDVRIDPGDGRITPEMMRAVQLLQRSVYQGYAFVKYGVPNSRLLTKKEKYSLEIDWRVEPGSTKLPIDFSRAFTAMARVAASKLTGRQVLLVGLMVCSTIALCTWIHAQSVVEIERNRTEIAAAADLRKEELRYQAQRELLAEVRALSEANVAQMQILKAAYERYDLVRFAASDFIPWRPALMDIAPYAGRIAVNDITIDAQVAKKVAKIARSAAKVERQRAKSARDGQRQLTGAPWLVTVTRESQRPIPPMRLGRTTST